jgi:dTDP-4-amino-4,6-dideoxygalactose transaminase
LVLLEDNAQALGARYPNGQPAGSVGTMAVYSFNPKKILETGGGALTCADPALWKIICRNADTWLTQYVPSPTTRAEASEAYRNLYQGMAGCWRLGGASRPLAVYPSLARGLLPLLIEPLTTASALAAAWRDLRGLLEGRLAKAQVLDHVLANTDWVRAAGWKTSGVCWRYTFFVGRNVNVSALTRRLREAGFLVSNLYMPANLLLCPGDKCPVAESLGQTSINVCVDHRVNIKQVNSCARLIYQIWQENAGAPGDSQEPSNKP